MKQLKVNFPDNVNLNDLSRFTAQVSSMLASLLHQKITMSVEALWNGAPSVDLFLGGFQSEFIRHLSELEFSPFDVQRILMSYSEVFPDKIEVSSAGDEGMVAEAKARFDAMTQVNKEKLAMEGVRNDNNKI